MSSNEIRGMFGYGGGKRIGTKTQTNTVSALSGDVTTPQPSTKSNPSVDDEDESKYKDKY